MPLVTTGMTRKFTFRHGAETITLDDPDPRMSPDRIMSFFSNTYPELTTATVHGPRSRTTKPSMSSRQPSE